MDERAVLRRPPSVEAFLEAAGPFLLAREAEHCLTLGICADLQANPETSAETPYFGVVTAGGTVAMTAVWTPPWQVVLSTCDDPAAVALIADDLADRAPIGINAPSSVADAFVGAWRARTGQPARVLMRERVFKLSAVTRPHGVSGALRHARPSDREHLIAWLIAFEEETFGERQPRDPGVMVDRSLAGVGRRLYVWDDDGPVSLCGVGGPTPTGIRIGPVFTPPGLRRRGYASACVAAVSQAQLDAGRQFCFLFADVANPTSNHVYLTIGYEPVSDVTLYRFS
jgi:predicted GNAT family acetyltransferase